VKADVSIDIRFIASVALREKRLQDYPPIIAVHKWFARWPGTLRVREYRSNDKSD
jgi:hypothetical protein